MTIKYYTRSAYGVNRAYLAPDQDDAARALSLLTGAATITAGAREALCLLGHELEHVEDVKQAVV